MASNNGREPRQMHQDSLIGNESARRNTKRNERCRTAAWKRRRKPVVGRWRGERRGRFRCARRSSFVCRTREIGHCVPPNPRTDSLELALFSITDVTGRTWVPVRLAATGRFSLLLLFLAHRRPFVSPCLGFWNPSNGSSWLAVSAAGLGWSLRCDTWQHEASANRRRHVGPCRTSTLAHRLNLVSSRSLKLNVSVTMSYSTT